MKKRGFVIVLALLMIVAGAMPSCTQSRKLVYRLKWVFNASVAGDIFAYTNNYFEQAGLTVDVREGSPEKNAINELELGHVDFGVASADQVIRALDKGAKIKVIAQIFQVNPMQWIYRADKIKVEKLQDLKKYSIGITFGGNDETIMRTLLAKAGIEEKDINFTGVHFNFTPFLKKEVDVWPVYRNSQGVILKDRLLAEGENVGFLNPADYGVQFVANSIITTEKMVKDEPDVVKKFLKAVLSGWEAAMAVENEQAAVDAVSLQSKDSNTTLIARQLRATRALVKPSQEVKVGTIDLQAWKKTEQIMLKEKQIKKTVNIEKYLISM